MNNITLLNYNNYYNRVEKVIKPYELNAYMVDSFGPINFNVGDGVNTTQILNTYREDANYLVVTHDEEGGQEIDSRWFIIQTDKTRGGQYQYMLKRDVIADHFDQVVSAPMFVEKAILKNNDPMIFNNEGITLNKIKKAEYPLKDQSGCGWIVGYTQIPNTGLTQQSINIDGTVPYETVLSLGAWDYYKYTTESYYALDNLRVMIAIKDNGRGQTAYMTVYTSPDERNPIKWSNDDPFGYYEIPYVHTMAMPNTKAFMQTDQFKNLVNNIFNTSNLEIDIRTLQGKYIKAADTGKLYYVNVQNVDSIKNDGKALTTSAATLVANLTNTVNDDLNSTPEYFGNYTPFSVMVDKTGYRIYLQEVVEYTGDLNIDANNTFLHLAKDADYAIFTIPCPKIGESVEIDGYTYDYNKSVAIGQLLSKSLGAGQGGFLIDLQLLPYCPILNPLGNVSINAGTLSIKGSAGAEVAKAYLVDKSSFSFEIPMKIDSIEPKIEDMCDLWRIVSPNYASSFEFSVARNGGLSGFHVNCTYKPYTPYINVHPIFGGLYGSDFDDNRGLILAGDFSLPLTTEAWKTYQIENKNYSNIYDREMKSIDLANSWGVAQDISRAVTGVITGTIGAVAGLGLAGVPLNGGLRVGAGIGAGLSTAAGVVDVVSNAAMRDDARTKRSDMYGYQLGNVDNKPNSLVKSSAFDITYKMWPILEYVTCTDIEREAMHNKIKYNGMTVGRIGTIQEFLTLEPQYFQGQLIRSDITGDSHTINEIATRISAGIFIGE